MEWWILSSHPSYKRKANDFVVGQGVNYFLQPCVRTCVSVYMHALVLYRHKATPAGVLLCCNLGRGFAVIVYIHLTLGGKAILSGRLNLNPWLPFLFFFFGKTFFIVYIFIQRNGHQLVRKPLLPKNGSRYVAGKGKDGHKQQQQQKIIVPIIIKGHFCA